jgi:peroxiredoxin
VGVVKITVKAAVLLVVGFLVLLPEAPPGLAMNPVGTRPDIGSEAPDVSLPALDGRKVSLSEFRGQVVLLVFCSCYADTCCRIVGAAGDLLEKYGSEDLVIPLVCSEIPPVMEKDGYAELMDKCGEGYLFLLDKDKVGKKTYMARQLPTSFLIDREFQIQQRVRGVRDLYTAEFRLLLERLLQEKN